MKKKLPVVPKEVIDRHIKESEMPNSCKRGYRSAMTSGSRSAGIKHFCLECQGFDRQGITECEADYCSLWRFRPFQR